MNPDHGSVLTVSRREARSFRLPWAPLLSHKARELWSKAVGRRFFGQGLIDSGRGKVRAGFEALRGDDFHAYNFPQVWVERRQIPSVLDGRVPRHGARIVDLGCGPGTSTEILCHFADPSWTIHGFDLTPHYIEAARERAARGGFKNRLGQTIHPDFTCQSICEPLRANDAAIPDASIDLAISGGVVGLYLESPQAERLIDELRRVVKPGGFIALDVGPAIPRGPMRAMGRRAGLDLVGSAKSCWMEPRPKLIFQRGS